MGQRKNITAVTFSYSRALQENKVLVAERKEMLRSLQLRSPDLEKLGWMGGPERQEVSQDVGSNCNGNTESYRPATSRNVGEVTKRSSDGGDEKNEREWQKRKPFSPNIQMR